MSSFEMLWQALLSPWQLIHGAYVALCAALFQHMVAPVLGWLDMALYTEDAFSATEWFVLGTLELGLIALLALTLERYKPFEIQTDKQTMRVDMVYTALHRLGGFSLMVFFLMTPLLDSAEGQLRLWGIERLSLDTLWPALGNHMLLQFCIYLLLFDYLDYWLHRAQHRFAWWWALHSLHHAQRTMTVWSDNRNHLLDDLLRDVVFAITAWFISVEPEQFVGLILLSRVLQNLQHGNIDSRFGGWGGRILVSPHFHRLHHGVSIGHLSQHSQHAFGCNFGVLLPWWDMLHRTADFHTPPVPTGVADQLTGREYGRGFWAQQWLGVLRLLGKA